MGILFTLLLIFSFQTFAATSSSTKTVGFTSAEGSKIYANGGYAELRADVLGGIGTGYAELYESKSLWPDPQIYTINVNATNKPAASISYYLTRNTGYYVKATGDKGLKHKAQLIN